MFVQHNRLPVPLASGGSKAFCRALEERHAGRTSRKIDQLSASIQTMNATVDIDTTVGGEKKGKVIEFQQIRGYILAAETGDAPHDWLAAHRAQPRF